jgi:hypothetical protein
MLQKSKRHLPWHKSRAELTKFEFEFTIAVGLHPAHKDRPRDLKVANAIIYFIQGDSGITWQSQETLCELAGLTDRSQCFRSLKALEESGAIRIHPLSELPDDLRSQVKRDRRGKFYEIDFDWVYRNDLAINAIGLNERFDAERHFLGRDAHGDRLARLVPLRDKHQDRDPERRRDGIDPDGRIFIIESAIAGAISHLDVAWPTTHRRKIVEIERSRKWPGLLVTFRVDVGNGNYLDLGRIGQRKAATRPGIDLPFQQLATESATKPTIRAIEPTRRRRDEARD